MEYIVPKIKIDAKDLSIKDLINFDNSAYLINLGFQTYYSNNVMKLYDKKYPVYIRSQFKGKNKRYKITQPYNYTIQENSEIITNQKIKTIENAFNDKYKFSSNKQDFYKLWEVITKYNVLGKTNKCTDEYSKKIVELNKKSLSDNKYDCLIINNHIKLNVNQEKSYNKNIIDNIKLIDKLNKSGNMILKLYTTFTQYSVDLIALLSQLFNKTYIYIPHTVETYRNEKYLVCLNYLPNDKINKFINELNGSYISLNINLPEDYIKFIFDMNRAEMVKQTEAINQMEEYIKNNNYFGSEYEEHYKKAVKKSAEWIKEFIK